MNMHAEYTHISSIDGIKDKDGFSSVGELGRKVATKSLLHQWFGLHYLVRRGDHPNGDVPGTLVFSTLLGTCAKKAVDLFFKECRQLSGLQFYSHSER